MRVFLKNLKTMYTLIRNGAWDHTVCIHKDLFSNLALLFQRPGKTVIFLSVKWVYYDLCSKALVRMKYYLENSGTVLSEEKLQNCYRCLQFVTSWLHGFLILLKSIPIQLLLFTLNIQQVTWVIQYLSISFGLIIYLTVGSHNCPECV